MNDPYCTMEGLEELSAVHPPVFFEKIEELPEHVQAVLTPRPLQDEQGKWLGPAKRLTLAPSVSSLRRLRPKQQLMWLVASAVGDLPGSTIDRGHFMRVQRLRRQCSMRSCQRQRLIHRC